MKRIEGIRLVEVVCCLLLSCTNSFTQGLLVDQASGTSTEIVSQANQIPNTQIVQSFTPSLSAVGYVQFQTFIPAASSGETVIINLRQNAYNGPIVSSTTPVLVLNKITQISTFYFSGTVPVTPNQVYYFEPELLSSGSLFIGYKPSSTYTGGIIFINGVPSGPGDLWFQEGTLVPEPGGVWLLSFGGSVLF